MRAGTGGYEVLTVRGDGDAGVAARLVAWLDRDGPRNAFWPFYCWFHDGRWKYLPNPGQIETRYQDVPEDLEPRYERLATWFAAIQQQEARRLEEQPSAMIARRCLAEARPQSDASMAPPIIRSGQALRPTAEQVIVMVQPRSQPGRIQGRRGDRLRHGFQHDRRPFTRPGTIRATPTG